jgi:Zn-dependent protease with chaperone function
MSDGPRLENRLAPDDDHGRPEHPLAELAWLLAATFAVLVAAVVVVGVAARWLAPHVPFEAEVALAERLLDGAPSAAPDAPADPGAAARDAALQALADRVAATMALPAGMCIVVRAEPGALVNAYATIGGRIRVYHGLLALIEHEAELAALLAHEIAHVKHRHVAANLGRGVALALLLGVVSADAGAAVAQGVLGQATQIALLGYSREQERQADEEALRASGALYGHASGLERLLRRLAEEEARRGGAEGIELLRTHPHGRARLAELRAAAERLTVPLQGAMAPLDAVLKPPRAAPSAPSR